MKKRLLKFIDAEIKPLERDGFQPVPKTGKAYPDAVDRANERREHHFVQRLKDLREIRAIVARDGRPSLAVRELIDFIDTVHGFKSVGMFMGRPHLLKLFKRVRLEVYPRQRSRK